MRLYLDASALVKLVQVEAESAALRRYLRRHGGDERATSALSRVEVVRAVLGGGVPAVAKARRQLGRLYVVPLDRALLDDAATLGVGQVLRSLEAIHLAAAKRLGPDLRSVITYDHRLHQAADAVGLPVVAPS
ncbi:MAG: type II toxin-antitoxin system VapC family toxin [Acidimicrobiia bacterium]